MAIAKPADSIRRRMTEEEFLRLPDDGRKYELVDGEAKEVPAGFEHDVLGMHIGSLLIPYAKGLGYVAGSQAGFRMTSGNIRSPDVSFTLKTRLPEGRPTKGFADFAPDIAIEILSPSEEPGEIARKLNEYFASGAQQVWHLDPEKQHLKIFRSRQDSTVYKPEEEVNAGDLLPGFSCRVSDLFVVD